MEKYTLIIDKTGKILKSDYSDKSISEIMSIMDEIEDLTNIALLFVCDTVKKECYWKNDDKWVNSLLFKFNNLNLFTDDIINKLNENDIKSMLKYLNDKKLDIEISIANNLSITINLVACEYTLSQLLSDKFANLNYNFFEACYNPGDSFDKLLKELKNHLSTFNESKESKRLAKYLYNIFIEILFQMDEEDFLEYMKYNVFFIDEDYDDEEGITAPYL